ncbi:MAG: hypothetical protein HOK41_13425 [Nitrospina sp.]|jgi:multimeric flavodoxin WrbA|nr:hypothetical protein [Nitrospina sp.]
MTTVLGISCSLRNARFGAGSDKFVGEIKSIRDEAGLKKYLEEQTKIRVKDFISAGREDNLPFDELYQNLVKSQSEQGLSNSEAALAAGLWGAHSNGAEILHCGLAKFFPMNGSRENLDALREMVLKANAFLISGPVYFGDRGSLAQEFIEFLREDKQCADHIKKCLYGGIAVGAKRNGGQETTLIYQIVDATNLNMLAVGNDSETSAQYGGTAVAGDVGTLASDDYGVQTSIGTGRRLANVGKTLEEGHRSSLNDKIKVSIWLTQDISDHRGLKFIESFCREVEKKDSRVSFDITDFTCQEIYRCIACDICPTDTGDPKKYRCIIHSKQDVFKLYHNMLIDTDAILLAAYSPVDRGKINSVYQRFIERTRYLRRDDFVIGDRLVAPLVISEINSNQNLHIRILTSMLRHHTVLHRPVIGMEYQNKIINWETMVEQGLSFIETASKLTAGRIRKAQNQMKETTYNPIGYTISAEKLRSDQSNGKTEAAHQIRKSDMLEALKNRLD